MNKTIGVAFTAITLLLVVLHSHNAPSQLKIYPGNTVRGQQVLLEQGCLNCHSLSGRGGTTAPDLSRTPAHATTPEQLATAMWNHATLMWATPSGTKRADMTTADSADMFAYLYSALYFAPPGNADRGRAVFETRHCVDCHARKPVEGKVGPAMSEWPPLSDPIMFAERMWNHSSGMIKAAQKKQWPLLSSQDVSDLIIYIRSVPEVRMRDQTFRLGVPDNGRAVFERNCETCHSFGNEQAHKIDLLGRRAPATVVGYIAAMWNHAPAMHAKAGGVARLQPGEMSDLVAFLFSQSYFFARGDPQRGRRVFETKNCADCHEKRRKEVGAPDLTQSFEEYSPITMTAAVFRHGPAMLQAMRQNGQTWPHFEGSEMTDLIAYLNSRVIKRVAPGQ
jgi:cytochrome c2